MQPSSLVFLAIVALWAAYLLPQWIRRRDLFVHRREEDRDSGRQRVLDPRRQRGGHGRSTEPLLGSSRGSKSASDSPDGTTGANAAGAPVDASGNTGHDTEVAVRESSSVSGSERDGPPMKTAGPGNSAARRRAQVLAGLAGIWTVSGVGAVFGAPIVVVAVTTVLLVAYLAALRAAVVREAARRVVPSRERLRPECPADGTAQVPQRRPTRSGSADEARKAAAVAARRRAAAAEALAGEDQVAVERLTEDSSWEPTPVPVPTYTLKPMAPRPEPAALDLSTGGFDSAAPVEAAVSAEGVAELGADSETSDDAVVEASGGEESESAGVAASGGVDGAEGGTRRPWGEDRQWADDLDLDAVLARRRAVNG